MTHDSSLLATVVAGLALAFLGGLVAGRLRLPPLVGYLLAGVAIGPFTPGFVADADLAGQLAEIGVILLMFGIGLHFSIADLLSVRAIAIPGAILQIAVATAVGTGIAVLWGWDVGAGLVLGLALSVASTVVLLRALEERLALDTMHGRIAVGWLVVEDLLMVLALVLLPALAGPLGAAPGGVPPDAAGDGLGLTLLVTVAKVAGFVVLALVVGTRVVPWVLEHVARGGSREMFTLAVLVAALGIAYGSAELFGVSFALGAFFAGVVLSESDVSHQAAADSLPLQDAFAVLFFVSIGMLFDPAVLVRQPLEVLAVLLVILLGKSLAAFAIVLAFGYPVTTALTVAASLAQIGEFSFILAGLGTALGVLPPEGRDLILAGALLSITLNPLLFAALGPLGAWFHARPGLLKGLERGDHRLAALPPAADAPRDHAIIVGYGRVGRLIGETLRGQNLPFVVVEQDRRRVEDLRAGGVPAVYGDATAPGVLEAAHAATCRVIVIATPDGFQTRRIVELARQANPRVDTAVRTHSVSDLAELERAGVGTAIMGARELALGLADYVLRSFGLSEEAAHRIVRRVRASGEGGAFVRRAASDLARSAPELRPHRDPDRPGGRAPRDHP